VALLAVKSDPPVGCLGPKATRPWAASGSKATRPRVGSPTFPDLFFTNETNEIVPKRPAGGSIRGENLPFPYDLPSAHSTSVRKGAFEGASSDACASATIGAARPTSASLTRTDASSSIPNASYRPLPPAKPGFLSIERTTP
jgi:hypothetical protein